MNGPPQTESPVIAGMPSFLNTIKGIWLLTWKSRLAVRRLPLVILLLLALPVLTAIIVRYPASDDVSDAFYTISVFLYFLQILPLACLIVCGAMIRDEIQADTLGFLITRPLSRFRLFLAKYLSHMFWLQILFLVESLLFLIVGLVAGVPHLLKLLPLALGTQILSVLAWSALSSLMGLLTKNYIVWGILYGFIVEIGIGKIPTNINTLSLTVNIKRILSHSFPGEFYGWPTDKAGLAVLVLLMAPIGLLAISGILFTWREYLHSHEFQK